MRWLVIPAALAACAPATDGAAPPAVPPEVIQALSCPVLTQRLLEHASVAVLDTEVIARAAAVQTAAAQVGCSGSAWEAAQRAWAGAVAR